MSKRKEIFKDAGIYAFSSYIAQAFDIVNGVLLRRFLGPENMGIWAFLQVIQNYAKHAGLGVSTATSRDVPYFLGKGDKEKALLTQNLVFSFTVCTALSAALCIVGFAVLKRNQFSQPIYIGLFVIAALILLQRIYNLFVVVIRSHKSFEFAGLLNIASSIINLCLTIALTWKFKLWGFFAASILNYLILIGFILARTPHRFTFYWDWNMLKPLLTLGMVMVVSDILRSVLLSIDRLMIAKFLGFEALGYYSIALMSGNYLYALPNMLGIIFFPHLQEAFARRDSKHDLEKYLREPALIVAYLFPFLIAAVWIISQWIFPILLPQYINGIPALKFYILGSFFLALTHPYINFIITIKKHWDLIPLQLGFVAFGFAVTWFMIKIGLGLTGVAIAGVFIAAAELLALSFTAMRQVYSFHQILKFYLKLALIFFYFTGILFGLDHLFFTGSRTALTYIYEFLMFSVLFSPAIYGAEKDARVLTTIGSLIRDYRMNKRKEYSS